MCANIQDFGDVPESVGRHREEILALIREVLGSGPEVEPLVERTLRLTARRARELEFGRARVGRSDLLRCVAHSAVQVLLQVHGPEMRRVIRRQVDSDADAVDVRQNVIAKLLDEALEGRRLNRVGMLVRAKHAAIDLWRRKSSDLQKGEMLALEPDLLRSVPPGPDREARDHYIRDLIEAALETLPEAQREAFIAHDVLGYGYEEAGEILGKSPKTLKQEAWRARKRIRRWLAMRGVSSPADV